MYKFNDKAHAEEQARRYALSHGMSIFDGKFYVGTRGELLNIGVLNPEPWKDLTDRQFAAYNATLPPPQQAKL